MTSKVRAVIQRACDRRWLRRDRHELPVGGTIIPVLQGKRGMLWAWHGRLSQPLSPAGGIKGVCAADGPDIPSGNLFLLVPGVKSRAVMLPENTANIFGIVVEWNKGGWGYPPGLKYASDRQDPLVGS